ncbi:TatD family hydrolase [Paenibacillus sp. JJ1722]|uniref:TatD family hydrolase n=1 Tax=Paenibacillus sp. JJ1722 TaxID=3398770 RepID=UPI003AAE2E8F
MDASCKIRCERNWCACNDRVYNFSIKGAIFHWYSGSLSLLKKIVEAGYYFSINPAMIQSSNGCKIIEKIPRDRLLTETDGPFVKIEGKVITSQDISLVLKYLGLLWNCSYADVELQIKSNFKQVLLPIKYSNER